MEKNFTFSMKTASVIDAKERFHNIHLLSFWFLGHDFVAFLFRIAVNSGPTNHMFSAILR